MTASNHDSHLHFITLVRHGKSLGNAEGRIQGQSDYPLTQHGLQQARLLAAHWQAEQVSFERIISSPLTRARQTAEIVAEALCIPVNFDPAWMERNFGRYDGRIFQEILQEHPEGLDLYHPYDPVGETGESVVDLYVRAGRAVQDLLRCPPGRYLVVSHGAILNMALYAILGLSPQGGSRGPRFRFGNTAVTQLSYDSDQRQWWLLSFNNLAHLQAMKPGLAESDG